MDLQILEEFVKSKHEFKLTKTGSKRSNSHVDIGQFEIGELRLFDYPATDKLPEAVGVMVVNNRSLYGGLIRTSPIIKITKLRESSAMIETEGGFYLLEKL